MPRHSGLIRQLLAQEPMTARQLLEKAEISQPTVSRALAVLDDEMIRVGAGSAIRYALRDIFRGFTSVPIFPVSDEGLIRPLRGVISGA